MGKIEKYLKKRADETNNALEKYVIKTMLEEAQTYSKTPKDAHIIAAFAGLFNNPLSKGLITAEQEEIARKVANDAGII